MAGMQVAQKSIAEEIRGGGNWTETRIKALAKHLGSHAINDGLYLRIRDKRKPTWAMRYTSPTTEKRAWLSIGPYPAIALDDAIDYARRCRKLISEGADPREHRDKSRAEQKLAAERGRFTVRHALQDYYDAHAHEWKEGKTKRQWLTLVFNNMPTIIDMPVSVFVADPRPLHRALGALSEVKHPTYEKCRKRLNAAFREAKSHKLIDDNPLADLRQFKRPPDKPVKHYNSLDWEGLPEFIPRLQNSNATQSVRLALEFCLLGLGSVFVAATLLCPLKLAKRRLTK